MNCEHELIPAINYEVKGGFECRRCGALFVNFECIQEKALLRLAEEKTITRAYAIKLLKNVEVGLRLAMLTNPHLTGMAVGVRDCAPREIALYAHRRIWEELGLPESALPEIMGKPWPWPPKAALDVLEKHCDEEVMSIMREGDRAQGLEK